MSVRLSRRTGRRIAIASLTLAVLPTGLALALVRPAEAGTTEVGTAGSGRAVAVAAGQPLGRFGLTTSAAALTSSGNVAAGGGLILTDQGAATVSGRLDNSPSARAMAVAAEPGETYRTLGAQAGGALPAVPGATAQFPGGQPSATDTTIGATSADANQAQADASATATPSGASDTGAVAASAAEKLTTDAAADAVSATTTSNSGAITVGPLSLAGVVGTASVSYDASGHHASANTVITGATVAGAPVSIDASGVHLLGQPVLPPGLLPGATPAPVAQTLAAAGISLTVLAPVMSTTATGALADSGALVIHEVTPDLTSGTTSVSSATDVTLYLGRADATLLDGPAFPAIVVPTGSPTPSSSPAAVVSAPATTTPPPTGVPGRPAVPGRVVTTVIAGSAPGPALAPAPVNVPAAAPAPVLAAPVTAVPSLRLLGYHLPDTAAVAGFGVWEMLTLGLATTAAVVLRRRVEPEEEHLCPCP